MYTMTAVFITAHGIEGIQHAYDSETRAKLQKMLDFIPAIDSPNDLEIRIEETQKVEIIFSTWGMFRLTQQEIKKFFPNLKAIFYAAGSVQYFAQPFLEQGITVSSAAAANAIPVAEYAAAQIILAGKGYFQAPGRYRSNGYPAALDYVNKFDGNYNSKVGLIGAGTIGRLVIKKLSCMDLLISVFDPFLSEESAKYLQVQKTTLEELFSTCQVISNHLADKPETRSILNYPLFSRMRPTATFINTGRGAQVVESDLARALTEVPTRTALLDVTYPEPCEESSPIYSMANVFLTPHIAGSKAFEVARMGRFMLEEYRRFAAAKPLKYQVTEEMLHTMA